MTNFAVLPIIFPSISYGPNVASSALDASTEHAVFIFSTVGTKSIAKVQIYVPAIAGTPPAYDLRLETVTAAAGSAGPTPSGSLAAANTSGTFTPSAIGFYEVTLTAAYTPAAAHELLAVVINSASATGGNHAQISTSRLGYHPQGQHVFPFTTVDTSGAYASSASEPNMLITHGDNTYFPNSFLTGNNTFDSPSSATTPDEVGIVFSPNVSFTCFGLAAHNRLTALATDFDYILYDGSNNVLESISLEGDKHTNSTGNQGFSFVGNFERELVSGSTYRIICKPTTANASRLQYAVFPSTAARKHYLGLSDPSMTLLFGDIQYTSRTDAGSWTDDPLRICHIGPLIKSLNINQPIGRRTIIQNIGTY
jgi:hypothetical protein